MSRRIGGIAAVLAAVAALCAPAASASPGLLVGMLDDANTLGDPGATFPVLSELHVQVVRMTLSWRAAAPTKPADPRNPDDPAYNWARVDRADQAADDAGVRVLQTVGGTPAWANA